MISEGANRAREQDPELARRTWALRTEIEKRTKKEAQEAKKTFARSQRAGPVSRRLRILHLSDLHFTAKTDPDVLLQSLIADLQDREGGLGFSRLDYLVISGDLSNKGKADEFEQARHFISGLVAKFDLTAQRCIIVPGNHDLDWDEAVYEWLPARRVDTSKLQDGAYLKQGEGYLVRHSNYVNRFRSFSEHFYHPLVQQPYPLKFEDQGLSFLFPSLGYNSLLSTRRGRWMSTSRIAQVSTLAHFRVLPNPSR